MDVLTGIMGRLGGFGNGNGGNIALSIKEQVLRFLRSDKVKTYMVSARQPDFAGVGSVTYRKVQTLQNERYFGSNNSFQEPQSDLVTINLNKAMVTKWKYETFNMDRVKSANELIAQVAATVYESMSLQLNAALLLFLKYHTLGTTTLAQNKYSSLTGDDLPQCEGQFTKLTSMGKTFSESGAANIPEYGDKVYQDYETIRTGISYLSQIYSKESFGVNTKEMLASVSPRVQISLSAMGRNQTAGTVGNFQIQNVSGTTIAGFKFFTDDMLDNNIPLGSSFNKDYNVNTENVLGFLIHNEAIAMPIGKIHTWGGLEIGDGNPYFGMKWMYGIGFLRKQLVWAFVKDGATVDFDNYFITGGNLGIDRTFDSTAKNGDWKMNRFAKKPNSNAFQQAAFVQTAQPNVDTNTTGAAQGITQNNPEPQSIKVKTTKTNE